MPFETALPQWEQGLRRLQGAPYAQRQTLERVTGRVLDELRRRLGGPFTVDELAEMYDHGTSWAMDVAIAAAPDEPDAWQESVVADAAFARYLREASDYAGGIRRGIDDDAEALPY